MYTYVKDHELFVLVPMTGRIYRISLSGNGQDLVIIHDDTLIYEADVAKYIKDNNAQLLMS